MNGTLKILVAIGCILCIVAFPAWAQDSRQGDSLALVAIQSANGNLGWNTATKINTWSGVTAEAGATDRVTGLSIQNKSLGSIPPEIGNLTKMDKLALTNTGLGEIPADIGKCTALTELLLDVNYLISLPKEIGSLANLTNLRLCKNSLESVPKEIGSLSKLTDLDLAINNLTEIPVELKNLSNLNIIILDKNMLHFADIELMKPVAVECYYELQNTLGSSASVTVASGSKIGVKVRGSRNHYAWTKDGSAFGTDADSVPVTLGGVYVCTITSDSIKDLILTYQPITVTISTKIITDFSTPDQSGFALIQNHQNRLTTIRYLVPVTGNVSLAIFDLFGKKVSTLVLQHQQAGNYTYQWDSGDRAGGTYFCRLSVGNSVQARKFVLVE